MKVTARYKWGTDRATLYFPSQWKGEHIEAGSITASHIVANTITVGQVDFDTRLFTDAATKTNVEAWRHASDVTLIDGGDIYTGSITANKIATGSLTATQIKGTDFGTLTITSGKIAINTTDALEIQAGGNIKILAGGDINLTSSDSNPSVINFDSKAYIASGATEYRELCMWPHKANSGALMLGYRFDGTVMEFEDAYLFADYIHLSTGGVAGNGGYVKIGSDYVRFQIDPSGVNPGWIYIEHNSTVGGQNYHLLAAPAIGSGYFWNLGDATNYWNVINHKVLTDRGCLGHFGQGVELQNGTIVSDLEAIKSIQVDTRPGKTTHYGVPMFDYRTMPKAVYWPAGKEGKKLFKRDKNDEPYKIDKEGNKIPAADGADLNALISIMIGAIKELSNKIDGGKN